MSDRPSFETAVRALAAEARRGLGPHLLPEELLDYHAGDVSGDEREIVQEHLALCPVCSRALLDLESFPQVEPMREEDRLSEEDLAREWRRFEETTGSIPLRRAARTAFPSSALAWAMAASLLLVVVSLSVWIGHLRQELSAPRADVYIADLTPREESRERSAAGEETVRAPAWADRILLILNLAEPQSHPEYRLEIATPEGREIWSRRGVRPSLDGNFTLEVPRRFLAEGAYVVRLYGLQGNTWAMMAEYRVRIQG